MDEIGKQGKVIEGMKEQMDLMFREIMGGRGKGSGVVEDEPGSFSMVIKELPMRTEEYCLFPN